MPIYGLSTTASGYKTSGRKYQSNEYNTELNLNWMDFNARQYDPQIGRFLGVDPLADLGGQDMFSPYAAMGNAPESLIDPDGLKPYKDGVTNDWAQSGAGASRGGGGGGALAGVFSNPIWENAGILDPLSFTFGKYTQQKIAEDQKKDAQKSNTETTGQTSKASGGTHSGNENDPTIDYSMIEYDNYQPVSGGSFTPPPSLQAIIELIFGADAFRIHEEAAELSKRSDGSRDWAGYSAYTWHRTKFNDWTTTYGSLGTYGARSSGASMKSLGSATKNLIRVRHHTSSSGLAGIKASGSINTSRGVPYGVDVEVAPFLRPSQVKLGQAGSGAFVEFSISRSQFVSTPKPQAV